MKTNYSGLIAEEQCMKASSWGADEPVAHINVVQSLIDRLNVSEAENTELAERLRDETQRWDDLDDEREKLEVEVEVERKRVTQSWDEIAKLQVELETALTELCREREQHNKTKEEIEQLNIAGATAVEAAKLFKQRAEVEELQQQKRNR
jgi:hypothetical protein